MKIHKYPDNTSYAKLDVTNLEREFIFKINNYEDLHHLEQIVDVYEHYNVIPTITIPNLIDAQADRRFNHDESSGLKIVCKRLNSMKAKFKILHPHNAEVVEALIDNVEIIDNYHFSREVLSEIYCQSYAIPRDKGLFYHTQNSLYKDLILMSSDAGGFKPLSKLCDKLKWKGEMYSASKARSWDDIDGTKFIQQIDRQDFQGKDILIVDDICVYGGTFKGLSKLLKERNCGKLYLAVSHMTVQNLGEDPVTNYFDKVFTTNSKYDEYVYMTPYLSGVIPTTYQPKNLEIIKIF
jgi:ribose-phosphate pyrophosphokinase